MRSRTVSRVCVASLACAAVLFLSPAAANAADPQAPPAKPKTSPAVVERVENTAIFAPDFKYTSIDNTDGFLLGGYGGVLLDNTIFLGGGGYWMVNGDELHRLGYGGVIVEWHLLRSKGASVSVGGLTGFGIARVSYHQPGYGYPIPVPDPRHGGMYQPGGGYGHSGYWIYDQGFMVGEPQVSAIFKIADGAAIAANVGYRFAAFANHAEDQIRGLTAGVSIRFGSSR
jgi:hypothetical protein